ncbi:MAG: YtfJ family protein [Myxococcota bacterium]
MISVAVTAFLLSPVVAVPVGRVPPVVTLKDDLGGRLDGTPWSSREMVGKPTIIFYVDPDEAELNEHVGPALRDAKADQDRFVSIAIINMDATWLPNYLINRELKSKQEEFRRTVYVRDDEKTLVKKWGIGDDTYAIAIFDASGKCIYSKDGRHDKAATAKVVDILLRQTGQR